VRVADEQAALDQLGDTRLLERRGVGPARRLDGREQLEVGIAQRVRLPAENRQRDGLRRDPQAYVAAEERRQVERGRVAEGEEEVPGPADPRRRSDQLALSPNQGNHGNGNHGISAISGRKIQGNQGNSLRSTPSSTASCAISNALISAMRSASGSSTVSGISSGGMSILYSANTEAGSVRSRELNSGSSSLLARSGISLNLTKNSGSTGRSYAFVNPESSLARASDARSPFAANRSHAAPSASSAPSPSSTSARSSRAVPCNERPSVSCASATVSRASVIATGSPRTARMRARAPRESVRE